MKNRQRYGIIILTATFCYCNTLYGSFVFDDTEAIVKNRDVMPTAPLEDVFKNDFWGTNISSNVSHKSYRPLTILSYRLNVLFANSKLNAFHFHATNVMLYIVLCLLVVPVVNLFCEQKNGVGNETAYFSSLLFTVHPIHTEVVAAIVGRADLLSALLVLISIVCYRKAIKKNSFTYLSIAILLTCAAVLCKEIAISALGIFSVYDVFSCRKAYKSDFLSMVVRDKNLIRRNITLVIAGITILYLRLKVMNFEGPIFTAADNPAAFAYDFFTRVMSYNYIYFLNFLLLVWPQWLCFDWSMGCIPLIESVCDIRIVFVLFFWLCSIIFLCRCFWQFVKHSTHGSILMGSSLIVIPFIPASNLFFKVGFVIAERTLLLPSLGFTFLVVIGFMKIRQRCAGKKKILDAIFYITCTIFACRTVMRNFEWLTEESLFTSALNTCPLNAKVHYNVAKIAADKNNRELALSEYKIAIELNPTYEQAMNNFANLLREDSKFHEAEVLLRRALKIRPNFAAAWMNLGIVLTNLNKTEEAEYSYLKAISYRKKYPDCYYNLGNLYLDLKRHHEALAAWELAVEYKPTHTAAWSNTLVLLDTMQNYDRVLEMGQTALMYNPKSPALHFSLANTLGKLQQFEKAEKHFLEALNFNPYNALYYSNLGVLYHRWGKNKKARDMYKKALQLDPSMKTTENNLRKLQNKQ